MNLNLLGSLLILTIFNFSGCNLPDPNIIVDDFEKIEYEESFEDFPNPERGFYRYSSTMSSNYNALSESRLKAFRGLTSSSGAKYKTYNTLVFRYFVLDEFRNSSISSNILDLITEDFNIARKAGVKLIPRFCYTTSAVPGSCPEDFICPPYMDAPKEIVLEHIAQLAPIINEHKDIILCVQMGFIGTWGENYYTDYFGDASSNGGQFKLLDENWADRIEVLNAMLNQIDEELMIQVRYPQIKQRAIYGIDAQTNVPALTEAEAYNGSHKARIGYHNDCLFASPDDFGTYADYGNSSSPRKTDIFNLKPYFMEDSKYVLVGGETCYDGYSPKNDCEPAGIATTDLRNLHYTYLNTDYNNDVNNDWVDGGCMDSILLHLGYRYVLQEGEYEKILSSDGLFNFSLKLKNVGYAAISKERPVYLILRNNESGEEFKYLLETDIRKWAELHEFDFEVDTNNKMTTGTYQALLHLPDGHESIKDRSEYTIRFANLDMWEESTGYNDLGFQLTLQ